MKVLQFVARNYERHTERECTEFVNKLFSAGRECPLAGGFEYVFYYSFAFRIPKSKSSAIASGDFCYDRIQHVQLKLHNPVVRFMMHKIEN